MTPADHQLTDEDRARGREHALAKREARAELKRAVAAGDMTLAELLDKGAHGSGDTDAGRIEVGDAVLALPGVGAALAVSVLDAAALADDPEAHLNSLTERERQVLVEAAAALQGS